MGLLSPKQEAFLNRFVISPSGSGASRTKEEKRRAKDLKAFQKKHKKLAEKVSGIPNDSLEKQPLTDLLASAEQKAGLGQIDTAKQSLADIEKRAKAALKAHKKWEKTREKAQKDQDDTTEELISAPIVDRQDDDSAVGRVAREMDRQSRIGLELQGQFAKLHAALRKKNPTLTAPQVHSEQAFITQAADILGQAMRLSGGIASKADALDGKAAAALSQQVDAAIKDLHARFDKLAKDTRASIGAMTGTDDALEQAAVQALTIQQDEQSRKQYEKARRDSRAILDQLAGWESPLAPALIKEFGDSFEATPDDMALAIGNLAKFHTKALDAKTKHKQDFLDALKSTEAEYDKLIKRAAALEKSPAYAAMTKKHKAEVKDQLAMIRNVLDSGQNPNSFKAATVLIEDGNSMIADFETAAEKISEMKRDFKTIAKALSNSKNKKIRPAHNARLSELLQKQEADWEDKTLTTAVLNAKKLLGQTILDDDSYENLAKTRIGWIKDKETQIKEIHKTLKVMDKVMAKITENEVGKFNGDLLNRLKAAEDMVHSEIADMHVTESKLTEIQDQLSAWTGDTLTAQDRSDIYVDNAIGNEKADKEKQDKADLKAAYKQMEKDLSKSRKKNKLKSAEQEYSDIESLLKSAKSLIKKPESFAQANAIITRCRSRMETNNMAAPKIPIDKLKLLHVVWSKAVNGTHERLTKLIEEVTAQAGKDASGKSNLDDKTTTELHTSLEAAQKLLDGSAFNYASGLYAAAEAGKGTIKQAREEALRRIRILKEIIANDPVLKAAQANPFGVGGVLKPVYDALIDFEYKALIGV